MSNITISQLPQRNTILDETEFATQTGFITERITGETLKNYVASGLPSINSNGNIVVDPPHGVIASFIHADEIGQNGTELYGKLMTPDQPNITNVGTLANLAVTGNITVNGALVHTEQSDATFNSLNDTPIGGSIPSTGTFTTISSQSAVINGRIDAIRGDFNTINSTTISIRADISPSSNVNADLGTSGSWFRNVYARTAYIESIVSDSVTLDSATLSDLVVDNLTINNSLVPSSNVAIDIGTPSLWYRNIYGRAIHAVYADLAEKYLADDHYDVGTVVCIGGEQEITVSDIEYDTSVYGVVSVNPSYIMNSALHGGTTVGLKGRLPCKVFGRVKKGDKLVNGANGYAIAMDESMYKPGCVLGIALEDKDTLGIGMIEIVLSKF